MPNSQLPPEEEPCPYCGEDTDPAFIYICPRCQREGCPECMPGGTYVLCPECGENNEENDESDGKEDLHS
jgi:hypothetical protein